MSLTKSWLTPLALIIFTISTEWATAESPSGSVPWWSSKWKYRQAIEVMNPQLADKINTAVIHLDKSVARACRPDGRDIRIVNDALEEVPHQVIVSTPPSAVGAPEMSDESKANADKQKSDAAKKPDAGGRTQGGAPKSLIPKIVVEFLVSNTTSRLYHLYYGNPDAPPVKHEWKKKKGSLILTTGKSPGGNATSMKEMLEYAAHARQPGNLFGSGPVAQINHEDNPFGPDDYYVSIYKGTLFCPESGKYGFATDSDDASFLLIDGNTVAEYPHWGRGHVRGEWADTGEIDIKSGIHEIVYYQVDFHGGQLAQAGWKKPSDKTFEIIPSEAFVRELRTRPVASEEYKSVMNAFFVAKEQSALRINGGPPQLATVRFRSISSASLDRIISYKWNFGDGSTSSDPNPIHVYKSIGTYCVKLSVKDSLGYQDNCQREIEVMGQNTHKMDFGFEADTNRVVLYPDEALKLALAFVASAASKVEVSLDSRITTPTSLLTDEAQEKFTLEPSKWRVIEKTLTPGFALPAAQGDKSPEMTVDFTLSYHGVLVASKTIRVIKSTRSFDALEEKNGMFVDQQGCITVLRSGVDRATKERWRLESWRQSISVSPGRATDQLRIAVFEDVLCAPGEPLTMRPRGRYGRNTNTSDAASTMSNQFGEEDQEGEAYYTLIARKLKSTLSNPKLCNDAVLAKDSPEIKILCAGRRAGSGSSRTRNGKENHFLTRVIKATQEICSFDPHIVLISCSAMDILQHTPPDKFERTLSAVIDNILAHTAAKVVLVSPPPLALAPEASRPYALAMKRLAMRAGLPAVDIYSAFLLFSGDSDTVEKTGKGGLAQQPSVKVRTNLGERPVWVQLYQRTPSSTSPIQTHKSSVGQDQTIASAQQPVNRGKGLSYDDYAAPTPFVSSPPSGSDIIELYPNSRAQVLIAERIYRDGICNPPPKVKRD